MQTTHRKQQTTASQSCIGAHLEGFRLKLIRNVLIKGSQSIGAIVAAYLPLHLIHIGSIMSITIFASLRVLADGNIATCPWDSQLKSAQSILPLSLLHVVHVLERRMKRHEMHAEPVISPPTTPVAGILKLTPAICLS